MHGIHDLQVCRVLYVEYVVPGGICIDTACARMVVSWDVNGTALAQHIIAANANI